MIFGSVSYTHLDVYKRQDIDSNDGSLIAGILADCVNGGTVENCYTSGKIEKMCIRDRGNSCNWAPGMAAAIARLSAGRIISWVCLLYTSRCV